MVENMETCSIIILLYLFFLGVIFLSIVDSGCCVGFGVQHSVLLLGLTIVALSITILVDTLQNRS